ncbi:hypothetical protein [Methanogenium organophilum]|uniref:Uncharacterized protein n=1 Tax=Methanogenium organophilum TaxID=2199 RepID=A0A9X9S5F3_METOG|nr:hypothetical protein [Methanogenium organophilum]WAI01800.1 hypothetical protein OU421_02690 [Methanogenium organophilum]
MTPDSQAGNRAARTQDIRDALFSDDIVHCDTPNFNAGRIDDADDSADDDGHAGDDSDTKSSTLPPHFHPKTAKSGTQKNAHIDDHSGK